MIAPHQQSRSGLRGASSCRQFPVCDSFPGYGVYKTIEPLERVPFHVSVIQAEGEFVNVPGKVLFADLVVNSVQAAFQDRPHAFYAVGAGHAAHVLIGRMVDALLAEEHPVKIVIGRVFVCEQSRADFYVGMNRGLNLFDAGILDRHSLGAPATLPHSENSRLADSAAPGFKLVFLMLVAFQAADESLVNFYHPAQLRYVLIAGFAEPMENEPSRLLGDADLFRQLHRRDALAGCNEQVHRIQPFMQGNVGPPKNRASADREVKVTGIAAVESARSLRDPLAALAGEALRAIRPETIFEVESGRFLIWKEIEQFKRAYCAFAHRKIILNSRTLVKCFCGTLNIYFREASTNRIIIQ